LRIKTKKMQSPAFSGVEVKVVKKNRSRVRRKRQSQFGGIEKVQKDRLKKQAESYIPLDRGEKKREGKRVFCIPGGAKKGQIQIFGGQGKIGKKKIGKIWQL